MLKVELHAHTDQDPADHIAHTTEALIDHAARLGYHAVAVTLHDRYFDPDPWTAYARPRGIVLISGIERTIAGRHLLLINFPPSIASVRTFGELEAAKAASDSALVIAPHPFYPTRTGLGPLLDRLGGLVDAIEVNAMYTKRLDFNRRAVTWARANGKPTVGNTDLHLLEQMGTTYSVVDATPEPAAICHAIRAGRVTVITTPLSEFRAASVFGRMLWGGVRGRLRL